MEKKKSMILTIVAIATFVALVVGATYAYFQATGGQAANAGVNITTYTTDLLTFTTGNAITIYADQSNFADGLGNQSGTTFARAHLLANNKTNTATTNYYVYLDITNNTFEYTQEDSTAELLLQVTDPAGNQVESLSGLEYKTATDGKGQTIKGFDITTFEGLATIANNYEINANPEKEDTWNVSIVFINLDADQTKNTGKSLSASLTITKEAKTTALADWVKAQYTTQGANNLYYHDSTLENGAGDNSYRYAGSSDTTNNFVCFGSDAATCPDDNLYRIIGLFGDQVKLIKWDYATTTLLGTDGDYFSNSEKTSKYTNYGGSKKTISEYYWNYDGSNNGTNTWSASELNTVNLNKNFIGSLGSTWANKVATTTWKVGGNTGKNIRTSAMNVAYQNEIVSPAEDTTYNAKVGLMYVSDYGYAASKIYWTYPGYSINGASYDYRAAIRENWMYMGLLEWTIMRYSGNTIDVFNINDDGFVQENRSGYTQLAMAIRPVFYLNSDVTYKSGTGTKTDPITINLD